MPRPTWARTMTRSEAHRPESSSGSACPRDRGPGSIRPRPTVAGPAEGGPGDPAMGSPGASALPVHDKGLPLKHPDHRVEWHRREFRAWAEGIASWTEAHRLILVANPWRSRPIRPR
jgi:hypothetical protein